MGLGDNDNVAIAKVEIRHGHCAASPQVKVGYSCSEGGSHPSREASRGCMRPLGKRETVAAAKTPRF